MGELPFPPKDLPLKADVGALGRLLGEVLREQGGELVYSPVEQARQLARRRRDGEAGAEEALTRLLSGLEPDLAEEVVRAFSQYFSLVNLAERIHRVRRRRDYLKSGAAAQPGSLVAVLAGLAERGVPFATVREALRDLAVEPVFTAHPTEATRRTLLLAEQRMARALIERLDAERLLPLEEVAALGRVREDLTVAWQTEEHPSVRPSVGEEVEHVTFYLVDVVYRIVPAIQSELERAVRAAYGEAYTAPSPVVRFASWVGGDMDGNPNVGAETIATTLHRHRQLIVERYRAEVEDLFRRLSQSTARVAVTPALSARLEEYRQRFPERQQRLPARWVDMAYRAFLFQVDGRLEASLRDGPEAYAGPAELLSDLRLLEASLLAGRGKNAGARRVQRLLRRVETFGFHLAALDVRQDSGVHRRVVGNLLGEAGFVDLPAARRLALLEQALGAPPALPSQLDPESERTLAVFRTLAESRRRYGPEALGPYIISMATGPDDALAVLLLARVAGLTGPDGAVPLDVAPLFETVPDLAAARRTLEALLAHPLYREHLRRRGDYQVVMLGYSDSNKESGLAASRWALAAAQADVVAATDAAGVRLTLFHGRGGTASRGGSKPRDGILAQPPHSVRGHLRVTEQGEIIDAKYGLRDTAVRTLELMTGAVIEATLAGEGQPVDPSFLEAMRLCADESRACFRALVYDDPELEAYFRASTPIDVIERLSIGSRPVARGKKRGIGSLRAIPWSFAWMQSRQLITGWYGVGRGLEAMAQAFGPEHAARMAKGWPFFKNLLDDVEMVLAKADMPIAAHYAALAGEPGRRIFAGIRTEYERTRELVLRAQGSRELLDGEPTLQRAIRLRNPYVDPMSLVQADFLARWRAAGSDEPALERVLFTTVRGIARGLQNTG